MREVDLVVVVPLIRNHRQLVSPRARRSCESGAERRSCCSMKSSVRASSNSGLTGGLDGADVIDRIDDSPAEEITPDAIDVRLGEERIVLAGEPVAANASSRTRRCASPVRCRRELSAAYRAGPRMHHFAAVVVGEDDFFARACARLERHAGEERAELVILILRPSLKGVIVAFIATEANAEERLADVFGDLAGFAERPEIVDGRDCVGCCPQR